MGKRAPYLDEHVESFDLDELEAHLPVFVLMREQFHLALHYLLRVLYWLLGQAVLGRSIVRHLEVVAKHRKEEIHDNNRSDED